MTPRLRCSRALSGPLWNAYGSSLMVMTVLSSHRISQDQTRAQFGVSSEKSSWSSAWFVAVWTVCSVLKPTQMSGPLALGRHSLGTYIAGPSPWWSSARDRSRGRTGSASWTGRARC